MSRSERLILRDLFILGVWCLLMVSAFAFVVYLVIAEPVRMTVPAGIEAAAERLVKEDMIREKPAH